METKDLITKLSRLTNYFREELDEENRNHGTEYTEVVVEQSDIEVLEEAIRVLSKAVK